MLRTALSVLSGARAPGKPSRGRSVTTVAVPAVCALAVCVLTACGPVQMGAAAIVGSQRISTATLTAQVSNLDAAYRASHGRVQFQFPRSQMPQQVLGWLVRFQVRERMATRNHITVTKADSQRALAAIAVQARQGGSSASLTDLAVANGLPPDLLPELGRYQAIQNAMVNRLDGGKLPTANSALQALGAKLDHEQCIAAKSLSIQVSPRFGQFDYRQLSVVPAASTLSAPQAPLPSPTPKPLLTPPC